MDDRPARRAAPSRPRRLGQPERTDQVHLQRRAPDPRTRCRAAAAAARARACWRCGSARSIGADQRRCAWPGDACGRRPCRRRRPATRVRLAAARADRGDRLAQRPALARHQHHARARPRPAPRPARAPARGSPPVTSAPPARPYRCVRRPLLMLLPSEEPASPCQSFIGSADNLLAGGHLLAHGHDDDGGARPTSADNVQALREARGLTQQQIAKAGRHPARDLGPPRVRRRQPDAGGAGARRAARCRCALEELIAPPRRSAALYAAATLPARDARRGRRSASSCPRRSPASISSAWSSRPAPHGRRPAHAGHARVPDLRARPGRARRSAARASRSTAGDVVVVPRRPAPRLSQPRRLPAVAYSVVAFAPTAF